MLRLYRFVESCLPDTFENITYDSMDEDKQGQVGIFAYQSEDDAESLEGTIWENIKFQIQVTANSGESGMQEVSDYLRDFIKIIESKMDSGDNTLEIIQCKHIGPKAIKIKTNDYNIALWRCVINIKYNFV